MEEPRNVLVVPFEELPEASQIDINIVHQLSEVFMKVAVTPHIRFDP